MGMKTDLFQPYGHCWVFHICWHIECSTLTASSFRIWNISTRIPSPSLALFAIIWVVKIFFVQFCCVLFPPLLNIFYFCQVHTISVLYSAHLCMKCSLGISNFLEEISSLPHSIVFLYFFSLLTEEGFLISPCYSLELCIQMGVSVLWLSLSDSLFKFSIPLSVNFRDIFLKYWSLYCKMYFCLWRGGIISYQNNIRSYLHKFLLSSSFLLIPFYVQFLQFDTWCLEGVSFIVWHLLAMDMV